MKNLSPEKVKRAALLTKADIVNALTSYGIHGNIAWSMVNAMEEGKTIGDIDGLKDAIAKYFNINVYSIHITAKPFCITAIF
jgi:hypothetical protein